MSEIDQFPLGETGQKVVSRADAKIFDLRLFDILAGQARANPRRRQHLNLHGSCADPSQRLLNAIEPGSYIRPHRHLSDPKTECFVGLRGRLALVLFGDDGAIEAVRIFGPGEDCAGAELPPGVWHTLVSLEPGAVVFETKPGPFDPERKKDPAPWAPAEGSPEASAYLAALERLVRERGGEGR